MYIRLRSSRRRPCTAGSEASPQSRASIDPIEQHASTGRHRMVAQVILEPARDRIDVEHGEAQAAQLADHVEAGDARRADPGRPERTVGARRHHVSRISAAAGGSYRPDDLRDRRPVGRLRGLDEVQVLGRREERLADHRVFEDVEQVGRVAPHLLPEAREPLRRAAVATPRRDTVGSDQDPTSAGTPRRPREPSRGRSGRRCRPRRTGGSADRSRRPVGRPRAASPPGATSSAGARRTPRRAPARVAAVEDARGRARSGPRPSRSPWTASQVDARILEQRRGARAAVTTGDPRARRLIRSASAARDPRLVEQRIGVVARQIGEREAAEQPAQGARPAGHRGLPAGRGRSGRGR